VADPDVGSVETWHERTMRVLAANFQAASATCSPGAPLCRSAGAAPPDVRAAASAFAQAVPARYRRWYDDARRFYARYVAEQLHLAGSFARVSTGVLPRDARQRTG